MAAFVKIGDLAAPQSSSTFRSHGTANFQDEIIDVGDLSGSLSKQRAAIQVQKVKLDRQQDVLELSSAAKSHRQTTPNNFVSAGTKSASPRVGIGSRLDVYG